MGAALAAVAVALFVVGMVTSAGVPALVASVAVSVAGLVLQWRRQGAVP